MKRLEMLPERVRGVGEPPVNVGIRREQVAEFVMNGRVRDRHPGEQREPKYQCKQEDSTASEKLAARESGVSLEQARYECGPDGFHTLKSSVER